MSFVLRLGNATDAVCALWETVNFDDVPFEYVKNRFDREKFTEAIQEIVDFVFKLAQERGYTPDKIVDYFVKRDTSPIADEGALFSKFRAQYVVDSRLFLELRILGFRASYDVISGENLDHTLCEILYICQDIMSVLFDQDVVIPKEA